MSNNSTQKPTAAETLFSHRMYAGESKIDTFTMVNTVDMMASRADAMLMFLSEYVANDGDSLPAGTLDSFVLGIANEVADMRAVLQAWWQSEREAKRTAENQTTGNKKTD